MGSENKIKLLFATDGLFPLSVGGIQRHSTLLIQHLAVFTEYEIHVVHPHENQKLFFLPNVFEHIVTPISIKNNYLRECYRYSERVERVILRISPDLIYAQGLTVWKNAFKYNKILINNPHGLESFQAIGIKEKLVGFIVKRIQQKIFKASRIIASEGGHLTTILKKLGHEKKIVFLPNAVSLPLEKKKEYPGSNEPLNIFFMGRFVKNKGIHLLFECVKRMNDSFGENKFRFFLGGKGPLWDQFERQNTFPNVVLLGFLTDEELKQQYLKADIFLLPTLYEGMPTVVLEAMSYGVPVLVSDVGGTPELIEQGNGYLVQRNNVKVICDALLEYSCLSSGEKRKMGEAARLKVEKNFTWQKLAAMHVDLFKEINQKS